MVQIEFEPGALVRFGVEGLYGIFQTACCTHHGHRTVSQTVYLVQPTRFITRGHQKDVRPSFDLVRESVVVANLDSRRRRKSLGQQLEEIFILGLTPAKHHEREMFVHHLAGYLSDEIESL